MDDHGVPLADTDHPELSKVADTDLIGPDSKPTDAMGTAASIEIPLERQISFKFPTVITPSEQAEDVRHIDNGENGVEQVLTAKQAATAYAGELLTVDFLATLMSSSKMHRLTKPLKFACWQNVHRIALERSTFTPVGSD